MPKLKKHYTFFSDPGHGWLKVPKGDLKFVGVDVRISHYSYMTGGFAFLEEDCDANRFLDALKALGVEFELNYVNDDDYSPIREYSPYQWESVYA